MGRRGDNTVACDETFELGPFAFECDGHLDGANRRALEYHGGKLAHHASSPEDVGDVNVTFWTWVTSDDLRPSQRRRLHRHHPQYLAPGQDP